MARFVFLDRDGTINHDPGYVYRVEDYALLPGVVEALGALRDGGFRFAIVTNQSGIGRGLYTLDDFWSYQKHLIADLGVRGITIDATYVCPHLTTDGCGCRKPSPASLFRAREELGADLAASWVVGDHVSDVELGVRAGARSILVRTGHGEEEAQRLRPGVHPIVADLRAAAAHILQCVG